MYDGNERLLKNVRIIPELKRNCISLGTLDQIGYAFKAENGVLKVTKGALVVMKGERKNIHFAREYSDWKSCSSFNN